MSISVRFMKLLQTSGEMITVLAINKPTVFRSFSPYNVTNRYFADKIKSSSTSKQLVHGTKNEERVRVRRARPSDVARIIRFVKEQARLTWPGITPPQPAQNILFEDLIARTLAQGHSMLAEQQEAKRWGKVRGLALNSAVSPWDAIMLEKWARCIKCARSREIMLFTAHCLREPGLHDKYKVHTILQIILMISPETSKATEISQLLAKYSIQRGRDVGIPVLRFDVTDDSLSRLLQALHLKKEWEYYYEIKPEFIKEISGGKESGALEDKSPSGHTEPSSHKYLAVYTAFPLHNKN